MDQYIDRDKIDELLFQNLRAIYQFERLKIARFGLTYEEIYLLQFLRRQSSSTISEITKEMKIPISTLSRTIDRLQKKDFVIRKNDPDDRRVIKVDLSLKGRKHVIAVEDHTYKIIIDNLSQFTKDEVAGFIKTAEFLSKILLPLGDHAKSLHDDV